MQLLLRRLLGDLCVKRYGKLQAHKYLITCVLFLFISVSNNAQQITTDSSISLEQLILNNLAQGCIEISNISSTVNGVSSGFESYGYFERGASNFPFQNGIALSTGNINSAGNTLNTAILNEGNTGWGTDPDLESALNITNTLNATSIEFDFVSFSNQVQFNYLLASEEYLLNNPCNYADGFAFLIKEAGTLDPYENIALIPNTTIPVNTTTIHDEVVGECPAENESFYEGSNLGDTNYNGRTVVLSANYGITPNVKYHIKLVIADQSDENYDSAVFIEGNSFNASVDLGPDIETCATQVDLNGDINNNLATYAWYHNGALIPNETSPNLTATASGTYKIEVTILVNNTPCVIEDEVVVTLQTEQELINISNYVLCDDSTNDGVESFVLNSKNSEVYNWLPPSDYSISYHYNQEDAENHVNAITTTVQNTANPQTIYVRAEDNNNGCITFFYFDLIVNEAPEINEPTPIVVCDDLEEQDGITTIDLSQANEEIRGDDTTIQITYHYTQQDADSGYFPIYNDYTNVNPTDTMYVRAYNPYTGCYTTTTIEITVKTNPTLNTENNYINYCKIDEDGFEVFDLTEIIPNVLNGIIGVTATFHESETDALNGSNAIADASNYTNIVTFYQRVWIRVEDDTTACFSVTHVDLHINLVEYGFDGDSYVLCDDASNDGQEFFNLKDIETEIAQEWGNLDFVFYESQDDLDNGTNPLDKNDPYLVTSSPTVLYTNVADGECKVDFLVNLIINPALELPDVDSVDYCDTDTDGYTSIILETFDSTFTEGVNRSAVDYFWTEADALNNENRLGETFYNSSNPQPLYIRVRTLDSECVAVKPITINVITAPAVNYPENIIICDDDQDAYSVVDLTAVVPDIVTDTTDLEINYFTDYWEAFNNENPITNPESFNATNQHIYFRVKSTTTTCFNISWVYINVNTLPVFPEISTFENCESGINGVADFYFYLKDAEILNGQPNKQVLYYETAADADAGTNPIDKWGAYANISNPQTIYVRVENITDANCYGTSSFGLEVGSIPLFNKPENIVVCDDISNDGVETFDLNLKVTEIEAGIDDNLTVTFHTSRYDAENGFNPIDNTFTNYTNPQQIYGRITNGTYCHGITDFTISIVQVPQVTLPEPLEVCDTDYDGITTFDIRAIEVDILDVRQNNLVITYHFTEEAALNDTNLIPDPENYTNTELNETVYIKINNTISNCYVILPIELVINKPPPINEFENHAFCHNENNYFDLNTINALIVDDDPDALISYYANQADAEAGNAPISTDYTYNSSNTTIYIRIQSASKGCHYVYPFQLIVNPLPIANQPNDMEACDDVSGDLKEIFDFSTQNPTILGGQADDDFTITYYDNEAAAIDEVNMLDAVYNAASGQTIYARIENNVTGCFSITSFNVMVHPYPNEVPLITLCDVDYDETVVFDITVNQSMILNGDPANFQMSYFDDLNLIVDDSQAIPDPSNYTNLSNPQTVYIKVFNISANCYNVINQELQVNSPPAINRFATHEICDNTNKSFNLDVIDGIIVDNDPDALISYYESASNAENAQSPLNSNYTYTTTSDTIFIRIESQSRGCHYVYPFQLIINPLPIANKPDDIEGCDDDYDYILAFNLANQNAHVLGNQSAQTFTVTYYNTQADADSNQNVLDYVYHVDTEEDIFARIENNQTGCYSTTSFKATVRRKPFLDIGDQVICLENFPLMVDVDTGYAQDTYLWSPNGQTTPNIDISEIGTYSVIITSPYGCTNTRVFNVIESEQATIEITETVDFADPNNITITVSGIGDYYYQLDDNEPQRSNFFSNVPIGPRLITVIDANGCNSVSKEVVVIDVPKFVTPNGDGYFDTWHITGVDQLTGTIIHVFDRYGKLLKSLSHTSPGWDGTYNGHQMPASDYWYVANVHYKGDQFELKGHFALKR
ncbi:T9SS type B sorting domain-containing protein [Seonamhaeicola maritimus]|uniref:T9SS type B sorting domain-containing protein n=1 Tax=Seonamhaeicola maritimus TaxID=2591822 RepID=UPI002493E807|nr:choice-of-anchor L domain-containing protein [Seonamhaeicola maritimus]